MAFDPKKPVQTCDGRDARIICTDARGPYPIVALVTFDGDEEKAVAYTSGGAGFLTFWGDAIDLINVPERKTWWMNVYDGDRDPSIHKRHGDAFACGPDAVARAKLVFEDGKIVLITNPPLGGGDDE